MSNIKRAIQAMLDAYGDGWNVAQYVIVMEIERVNSDGRLESAPWLFTPRDQPEWMTDGLLDAANTLRAELEVED